MDATYQMRMAELMKNVTLEITLSGMKAWRARLYAGIILLKFAVWVMGTKGTIKVGNKTLGEIV